MNEKLIQEVKQLIAALQLELQTLKAGSTEYIRQQNVINAYAENLKKISGEARTTARELGKLESQMTKLTAAASKPIEERQARYRMAGTSSRRTLLPTTPLSYTQPAAINLDVLDEPRVAVHEGSDALPPARTTTSAERRQAEAEERKANRARERAAKAEVKAAEKRQKAAEEEAARVERNRNIGQTLPGGSVASSNLFGTARRLDRGYTPETLRTVETEPSTKISRATFSYTTDEGVVKKSTFTVDQFGKVLVDTQKRFRSFTSGIARDTAEVLKWSIAVAAIYGPLQKAGELIQDMIANETALAAVTVTLGNAQRSANEIFQAAYQISQAVGEETNKVLEAYNAAYRATGGIESATTRFVTANKLLTNALTLSKLSTLSETEAIDTLSAALKQVSEPGETLEQTLSRGSELLNKWVAVSKVANVDLETLATGFAVVGDAAETAGIDTDKLNAVIATIAETSTSSGKEVANTARAIIAGFQSDNARKSLEALGIAITDSEGKARNFLDISKQISQMKVSGLISDKQFSELTLAIGGGTRRQAPVATFIENLSKIDKVQAESAKATADSGEAYDALGKKLDTVQTASTRLGNAFQNLAQSLGESGGILDLTKGLLNTLNLIVEAFARVTNIAGKAGPVLIASLGALAYINSQGPSFRKTVSNTIGDTAYNMWAGIGQNKRNGPLTQAIFGRGNEQIAGRAVGFGAFAQKALPYAPAVLAGAIPAMENLSQGKNAQAVGNVVGAAIGGGIGTALGGPIGAMVGSSLGSAIAEGFVNAAENFKPELSSLFSDIYQQPVKGGTPETDRANKEKEAFDFIRQLTGATGFYAVIDKAIQSGAAGIEAVRTGQKFQGISDSQSLLITLGYQYQKGKISEADYQKAMAMIRELTAGQIVTQEQGAQGQVQYAAEIKSAQAAEQAALLRDLSKGTLGLAPYRRGQESLGNLGAVGSQLYSTFGKQMGMGPQDFFSMTARVTSRSKAEEITPLTDYAQKINELDAVLNDATKSEEEHQKALQEKNGTVQSAIKYMEQLNRAILSQAKLLQQVDMTDLTKGDAEKVVAEAKRQYGMDISQQVTEGAITEEQKKAIIDSLDEVLLKADEAYMKITGVPADYLNKAMQDLKEQGAIMDKSQGIGFQSFDMTSQEFQAVMPQYESLLKNLESKGYKPDLQEQIPIFKDGIVDPMKKDWKVVQYLLQEILNVNQKQLDGMYNLPEGASFWIPAQAAQLYPKNQSSPLTSTPEVKGAGATTETEKKVNLDNYAGTRAFREADEASMKKAGKSLFEEFAKNNTLTPFGPPLPTPRRPYDQPDLGSAEALKTSTTGTESFNIIDFFKNLFGNQLGAPLMKAGNETGAGLMNDLNTLFQGIQNLSTKLSLSINNTTTVTLDGRQIAAVVKTYLKNDLIRYSGGTSTKSVNVI